MRRSAEKVEAVEAERTRAHPSAFSWPPTADSDDPTSNTTCDGHKGWRQ